MSPGSTLVRLTRRPQFLYVRGGYKASRPSLLVEARRRADSGGGPVGLGFTASKKVGNAVARNRARRRLREAARRLAPEFGVAGVDYVLVARPATVDADWAALLDDLQNALIRLRADLQDSAGAPRRSHRPAATRKSPTESD